MEKKSRRRLTVIDRSALQRVALWARAHGVKGLTAPTLSRLCTGKSAAIEEWVYETLAMAIDNADAEDLYDSLYASVLTGDAHVAIDAYEQWRRARMLQCFTRRGPRWKATGNPEEPFVVIDDASDPDGALFYDLAFSESVTGAPAIRLRMVARLRLQFEEGPNADLFAKFTAFCRAQSVNWLRQELAIARALEPLLDAADSAFIERHVNEMAPTELRAFLKASLDRERILLNRPTDWPRAQALARDGAPYAVPPKSNSTRRR